MTKATRLRRAWDFGRHIPAEKLLRRLVLVSRRRADLWRKPTILRTAADMIAAARPPIPIFLPRTGRVLANDSGWRFNFLGRSLEMPGQIDWQPLGGGPKDQLWRMNLHYMEFLEELSPVQAAAVMLDWTQSNLPWQPAFWRDSWNSYSLSLRTVVWMQQFPRIADALSPNDRTLLLGSIARQILFLERYLETDLGGNHLIKNIKALIWASTFFTGRAPERWRRRALRLLTRELDQQILADGMHYERSPSYHAQVFADLLEIRHALGTTRVGRLDRTLAAMAQTLADLAHPDGGPALFNDSGLTMAYSPQECLAVFAATTNLPRPQAMPVFGYAQAGYFGMRHGGLYLAVDMGRIGPDDLPAHAHGDVGTFELSVAGERLIVDQGVYEYVEGPRRALSRSTASHNCLAIDGVDQADFFGSFRCGRRPGVTIRRWTPRPNGFLLEGAHDGFAHLAGKPIATRRIEASPQSIRISDFLEGTTTRKVSIGFLLHPNARPVREGDHVLVTRGGATIRISADGPIRIEPATYWPDMGYELATQRVRLVLPPSAKTDVVIEPLSDCL